MSEITDNNVEYSFDTILELSVKDREVCLRHIVKDILHYNDCHIVSDLSVKMAKMAENQFLF